MKHGNREVVHLKVTRSPSDAWAAQQLREATPFGEAPRYLIRDKVIFGEDYPRRALREYAFGFRAAGARSVHAGALTRLFGNRTW